MVELHSYRSVLEALVDLPRISESMDDAGLIECAEALARRFTSSAVATVKLRDDAHVAFALTGVARAEPTLGASEDWPTDVAPGCEVLPVDEPSGHDLIENVSLERFLRVFVVEGGAARLRMTVRDRAEPYAEDDVLTLRVLAEAVWRLLNGRQRERELTAVRAQCGTILETAPLGVFVQAEGRFLYANSAIAEVLGAGSAKELLGTTVPLRLSKKRGVRAVSPGGPADSRKAPVSMPEATLSGVDGSSIPASVSAMPFAYAGQAAELVFVRDLRETKRFEAEVRRMNQLYAALSHCNAAIVRCSSEKELFAAVCQVAVEWGGIKIAWVGLTNGDGDVVVAASAGDGLGYLQDIRVSVHADRPTGRGPCGTAIREGRAVWCHDFLGDVNSAPWREKATLSGLAAIACLPLFAEGATVGSFNLYFGDADALTDEVRGLLMEMAADISFALNNFAHEAQRAKVEAELEKLSFAIEQSPESIVITDVHGSIEYVNEAFVRSTGYGRAEVVGKNPRILKSGHTPAAVYADMWTTLRGGKSWKGEFCNRRKDGSEYVEFAIVTPLRNPSGRVTHYVAAKEDITEKKALASELVKHRDHLEVLVGERTRALALAQQRAEQASRAKGAFLADMSHEIRTPLNAIIGLTHLLRRGGATPQQLDRLDKIDRAGRHLLSIINDILDLSKVEAGRMVLVEADFHLRTLLDEVSSLIADTTRAQGVVVEVSCNAPTRLRGDPTRLRQALLNYASNAAKFTTKGSVQIRATLERYAGDGVVIRFEVVDTGPGIAPESLGNLFQAFAQVASPVPGASAGTGLGLAITAQLAKLMGGTVGVKSVPGAGSTFWFTALLQRSAGAVTSRPPPPMLDEAEATLRREHAGSAILLVEDNPVNREVSSDLLHAVGMLVDVAVDGEQAVEKVRARPYDLILMDVQMPRMGGIEATRAIRSLPAGRWVPILALTANAFEADRQACQAAGMNAFVSKPVDPPALYQAILSWLPEGPSLRRGSTSAAAFDGHEKGAIAAETPRWALDTSQESALARLAALPGLDVGRGMAVTRGRSDRYLELLSQLVDLHANDMRQLAQYVSKENYEGARRLAHNIKGSAANLGALDLMRAAESLEQKLREIPATFPPLDSVRKDMDAIDLNLAALAAALPPSAPAPSSKSTPSVVEQILSVLEKLDELLSQDDAAAVDLFREHAKGAQQALGHRAGELAQAIALFDFERAREIVRELRQDKVP